MGELIIFTKVPEKGFVKKKIEKKLPPYLVEEIYTAFLTDLVERLGEYDPFIAYYPEKKLQLLWNILGDRKYIVQRGGDMWERLSTIFSDFYRMGHEYVIALSCDVPLLRKTDVEMAFSKISKCDLVLGPARDGGFFLIGGRGVKPELFEGVPWKSPDTLERVCENAKALGLRVGLLDEQMDIDTPEDLMELWRAQNLDKQGKVFEILKKNQGKL